MSMKKTWPALLALAALAALAAPVARADEPRLGDDVVPTFQAIRLRVDPERSDYSGSVVIDLTARRPTREVRFHARGQTFARLAFTRDGEEIPVEAVERGAGGFAVLRTTAPLSPGSYRLQIDFTQAFDTRSALYRIEKDGRAYAFTQFQATDARGAFPCWDEPGFKIPWQMTLEVPAALAALANMPVESEKAEGDWKTLAFARTPPLPSYLLALAVGPFDFTPIPGLSVPGRIASPAGQGKLAGLAAEVTPAILAAAERYFGQPHPFPKLDMIAVPELWTGAMENPGAITYAANVLLLDPREATVRQRAWLVYVTGHELAHQWFGNLVTTAWWDDLWLYESLADWVAVKLSEEVDPGLRVELRELQDAQVILDTDARPSSRPIRMPVTDPSLLVGQAGFFYDKGKAVLGMVESWLGPEVFRRGVVDYLRTHAWGNAVTADFWAALERASGRKDVAAVVAGFLDQPGVPLIEVTPLPGGRLRIAQRRFLPRGASAPPLAWTLPVGLKISDGKEVRTVRVLLAGPSQEVAVPGLDPGRPMAWVMPDLDGAGYYRWAVPDAMLAALSRDAASALDARERIALAGNLAALLEAGLLGGDRYLEALAALADDPEPTVVASVITNLGIVRPFLPEPLADGFAAYVRRILAPAVARFGAEARPGEEEIVALLRPGLLRMLGEAGRDEAVLARAREATRGLLAGTPPADPSLAETWLTLAAQHGDRALFDELRRRFEGAQVPAERKRYLDALGAFRDPAVVEEALRYALEGPLRPNERFDIPFAILRSGESGRQRIFEWVLANYDRLAKGLLPAALARVASVGGGCSADRLARARDFFGKPPRNLPAIDRQLARIADEVALCITLREAEGPAIAGYLQQLAQSSQGGPASTGSNIP